MARQVVGLDLSGFDKLKKKLDGKFDKRFRKNVKIAQKRNGLIGAGAIKEAIHAGDVFAPNSPVTIGIKGSSRPLFGEAAGSGLVASITHIVPKWDLAFIGVIRSRSVTSKDGRKYDLLNVAFIMHEGASVKVTQKMRNFFAVMSREEPGKWFPLNPSTKVISIPGRPFLRIAIAEAVEKLYVRQWNEAIQASLSNRKMRPL